MRRSACFIQLFRPYVPKEVEVRLHLIYLSRGNAWIACKKMSGTETVLQKSLYLVHELVTKFPTHSGRGVIEYKVLSNFTSNLYSK